MLKKTELPFIRTMFDAIAPRYDLLNRLLSLRQDVYWRKTLVSAMDIPNTGKVLDVACGTADVGLEIIKQKGQGVTVAGVDFSPNMLVLGKHKIVRHVSGSASNICLIAGNAFDLPFKKQTFDAITIAFGIRNIQDKHTVLKIFHEHLKTNGMVLILELATPPKGFLLSLYMFYFQKILPLIGWLFSKHIMAYQYLPASVINFPQPEIFADIMKSAGFSNVRWKSLTLGIAVLYAGWKIEN